ncbi:Disease resistance protein [Camellia lanceoleosa]|uniref:Disease resistance protein n=1 Tax=Camellia lanceoleosa TaxID=1840588 RepID=A0ACC0IQ09_9ERIC|nr:Disease resistance protein [Camellia lanceoleosa]
MALKITSTSPRFMAKDGKGLEGVPYEDWSEDLERVSLMYNKIEELPFRPPICPRLTTLLLGYNPLLRIPVSFFAYMHHLNVLDLSGTYIESLPDSISRLVNLHTLLLKDCVRLKYVPSLEKLKALKELKLKRSQIEEVPQGIEELVNLKNLDLSWNNSLQTFPCWKLCRLSQLQCVRIDATRAKALTKELLCLRQLKVLRAHLLNVQELTSHVMSQQCQSLENYRLIVGNDLEYAISTMENEVHDNVESVLFESGIDLLVLPRSIAFFEI